MEVVAGWVLAAIAVVAVSACVAAWVFALRDLFTRAIVDPGERLLWLVALLLFPPVAALIYLRCGPGEGCLGRALGRATV